ncbi:MAG: Gfo/Idh/MocA family protein [Armatimonadota bacterium]
MNRIKRSRRGFLRSAGRALAGALVAPHVITSSALGQATTPPASERVTLGHIGVGGRGGGLLRGFLGVAEAQSVAVCDPFKSKRENWAEKINSHYADKMGDATYKGCAAYNDFRDLLAREDIDGVVIATHDGWHVPIAIAAARAGKDMYVEKPLGLSVEQNKALRETIRRYGRVFQYGTQQRSSQHCRFGCELIRNGRIGEIRSIQVEAPGGSSGGSTEPIPVPEDLDYDMWLGPAPVTPYTKDRCSTQGSYFVYDNSLGFVAGWGAHPLDILDWAYGGDEAVPVEYEGTGTIPTEGLFDTVTVWSVSCKYPNGVPMAFRSGPDLTKFIGTEGWVAIRRGGLDAEPKSLLTSTIGPGETRLVESTNHAKNFVDCMRTRTDAVSTIESAVRSDTISHLSDIAIRTGRKIRWDPKAETIIGDDTARRMLSRPMRSPWRI